METLLAIIDIIPNVICFLAYISLIKTLSSKMNVFQNGLLCAGGVMVFFAGMAKAIYKVLYYGFELDAFRLNYLFFPVISFGFIFAFSGLLWFIFSNKKKETKQYVIILPVILMIFNEVKPLDNTLVYVALQIIGCIGVYACLTVFGFKLEKKNSVIFSIVAMVLMLSMGYLSTRISRSSGNEYIMLNWAAEIVNILGQCSLFTCVYLLNKNGLKNI